jgi:hypothetical protein
MVGKTFAGFVVAFWLVTMGSLVRLEFFPKSAPLSAVPSSRVLRKIFSNPEPAHLNIFYRNTQIGHCNVEITPLAAVDTLREPAAGREPQAYRVKSDLTMTLSVFGLPSRMSMKGEGVFDSGYDIQSFNIGSHIGDGWVRISGDKKSGKVNVGFDMPDYNEQRTFDFDQIQGAGLANALGLPGLASFGAPGGSGASGASVGSRGVPVTTMSLGRLTIGDGAIVAYRIESKLDATMWARVWVDEAGDILRVETSIGLRMEDYHLDKSGDNSRENGDARFHKRWRSARP